MREDIFIDKILLHLQMMKIYSLADGKQEKIIIVNDTSSLALLLKESHLGFCMLVMENYI